MQFPNILPKQLFYVKPPRKVLILISVFLVAVVFGETVIFFKIQSNSILNFPTDTPTPVMIGTVSDLGIPTIPVKILKPCFQDGKSMIARGAPNNKFGMYMVIDASTLPVETQMHDISKLVNSNGGDWGYVLTQMYLQDLNQSRWEKFFALASEYHLTPIIQLMTNTFDYGVMETQLKENALFLNSINWPTSCRYVSVFNEVNAKEYWGDKIDPEGYALMLGKTIDIYKNENVDFFILNGSFNSSARTSAWYLDEEEYLKRMENAQPGIFKRIDGWASHPYPQPGFSGDYYNPPSWYGVRDQIKNYTWEAELLQIYADVSGLPVFFTETGWAHQEGNNPQPEYKSSIVTAKYFDDAYRNIWLPDPNVKAIIPFIYYLPGWDNFNWLSIEGKCYQQCNVVTAIPKTIGVPEW